MKIISCATAEVGQLVVRDQVMPGLGLVQLHRFDMTWSYLGRIRD